MFSLAPPKLLTDNKNLFTATPLTNELKLHLLVLAICVLCIRFNFEYHLRLKSLNFQSRAYKDNKKLIFCYFSMMQIAFEIIRIINFFLFYK